MTGWRTGSLLEGQVYTPTLCTGIYEHKHLHSISKCDCLHPNVGMYMLNFYLYCSSVPDTCRYKETRCDIGERWVRIKELNLTVGIFN